jgi:hypothetical protein
MNESVWGEDLVWLAIGAIMLGILVEFCIWVIERIIEATRVLEAGRDQTCAWCNGTGVVPSLNDPVRETNDLCPICDGSGKRWE